MVDILLLRLRQILFPTFQALPRILRLPTLYMRFCNCLTRYHYTNVSAQVFWWYRLNDYTASLRLHDHLPTKFTSPYLIQLCHLTLSNSDLGWLPYHVLLIISYRIRDSTYQTWLTIYTLLWLHVDTSTYLITMLYWHTWKDHPSSGIQGFISRFISCHLYSYSCWHRFRTRWVSIWLVVCLPWSFCTDLFLGSI